MAAIVPHVRGGLFESQCSTQFKKCKIRFKWTINDFRFYLDTLGNKIVSNPFSDGTDAGLQWRLVVNPHGFVNHNSVEYLALELDLVSSNVTSLKAKCKFSILNANLKEVNERNLDCEFGKDTKCAYLFIRQFIKKEDLYKREDELFPDDALTIQCEIISAVSQENSSKELTILACHVPDNLGLTIFEDQEFSDVTFCVDGLELKAHKAILAARSEVFRAMFQHDMKESRANRVDIEDVGYNTFKKMLYFVYADEFSDLEDVTDLIYLSELADKYQLDRLKLRCEEALSKNLSNQNVVECYMVADEVNAENLKVLTKSFIIANAAHLVKDDGIALLVQTHSDLIVEMLSSIN